MSFLVFVVLNLFAIFTSALTDREKYPDLFDANGRRRNEIDTKSVYVNNNRPIVGGFTTRWSDEFVTIIFVGTPSEFFKKNL